MRESEYWAAIITSTLDRFCVGGNVEVWSRHHVVDPPIRLRRGPRAFADTVRRMAPRLGRKGRLTANPVLPPNGGDAIVILKYVGCIAACVLLQQSFSL